MIPVGKTIKVSALTWKLWDNGLKEHINGAAEREYKRLVAQTYPISTLYKLSKHIGL